MIDLISKLIIAVISTILLIVILYAIGRKVAPREKPISAKEEPYACGERIYLKSLRLNIHRFYYIAFFLLIETGCVLLIFSYPAENFVLPVIYVMLLFVSLVAIPWEHILHIYKREKRWSE